MYSIYKIYECSHCKQFQIVAFHMNYPPNNVSNPRYFRPMDTITNYSEIWFVYFLFFSVAQQKHFAWS